MVAFPLHYPWLEVEPIGDVTVVRLTARCILDEEHVRVLGQQLFNLVDNRVGPCNLVLDFSRVQRVTSSLFGKIVALHKRVRAIGGRLVVCEISPDLQPIFDTLHLNRVLTICNQEEAALQAF